MGEAVVASGHLVGLPNTSHGRTAKHDLAMSQLEFAHKSMLEREAALDARAEQLDTMQSRLEAAAEVLQIRLESSTAASESQTQLGGQTNAGSANPSAAELATLRALVLRYRSDRDRAEAELRIAGRRLRAVDAERAALGRILENLRPGLLDGSASPPESPSLPRESRGQMKMKMKMPLLADAPPPSGPSA